MVHVVFAIPFIMENTLQFARAASTLPDVKLSVVSQDAPHKLPADFRERSIAWRQRSAMLAALNLDEVIKANLREIVAWGPAAKAFAVRSPRCAAIPATI